MTNQENYNHSSSTVEELTRNGLEAIPEMVRVFLNSVMQAERSNYLQAKASSRTYSIEPSFDLIYTRSTVNIAPLGLETLGDQDLIKLNKKNRLFNTVDS